METALMGVLENLCANCLFLPISLLLTWGLAVALGIVVYNWYGRPIIWARKLFGFGKRNRIDVFVSQHSELTAKTGNPASAEMTAVGALKDALDREFQVPPRVELLVEKLGAKGLRPTVPELTIRLVPHRRIERTHRFGEQPSSRRWSLEESRHRVLFGSLRSMAEV
jgi:hypothetical protein